MKSTVVFSAGFVCEGQRKEHQLSQSYHSLIHLRQGLSLTLELALCLLGSTSNSASVPFPPAISRVTGMLSHAQLVDFGSGDDKFIHAL